MITQKFAYIWEYQVKQDSIDLFIKNYNSDGDWVQLFQKGTGHIRTELLQQHDYPTRFITIDYWESKELRDNFRKKFSIEFNKLDKLCETFTESENFIGDFLMQQ